MKPTSRVIIATLVWSAASAQGAVIVADNFDSYANQAAFEAVWTPIGTNPSTPGAILTGVVFPPKSSPNYVFIRGTTDTGRYRNRQTVAPAPAVGVGDQLVWSFDLYDVQNSTAQNNYALLSSSADPNGDNGFIALGLIADVSPTFFTARIGGYNVAAVDPDGGPTNSVTGQAAFRLNDFGVGARSTGPGHWVNLKMVLTTDDATSSDFYFYVDNVLAEQVLNVGTAASILQYDRLTIGSGLSNSGISAAFDNLSLEFIPAAVPEVGSALAVGLAASLATCGHWSFKRRRARATVESL